MFFSSFALVVAFLSPSALKPVRCLLKMTNKTHKIASTIFAYRIAIFSMTFQGKKKNLHKNWAILSAKLKNRHFLKTS